MPPARAQLYRRDFRELVGLAAPAIALQLASFTFSIVDATMLGRVSTHAFDAASLGGLWIWGTMVVAMGVVFGIDPFISQAFGARDAKAMGLAIHRGIIAAVLVSVPVMVMWALGGVSLTLLKQDPEIAASAGRFVAIQIPGVAPFLVLTALRQYLANRRILFPTIAVLVLGNVLNAGLNWVLIFGHLGSPALGLDGSAIATTISRFAMLGALIVWIRVAKLHENAWTPWSRESFSRAGLAELFRFGVPVGLQMGSEVWAFQFAMLMAGWLGKNELAAYGVVLNLASLSFMMPLGVAIAAGAMVGNRIGEKNFDGARRASRLSLAVGAGVMLVSSIGFTLLRNVLPVIYGAEPAVAALASAVLPIAAAFQLFDGTQAVGCGVLRGMGISRPAAIFNLVGYYGLALPLAWWLAGTYGLIGIWWGLAAGLAVIASLLVFWIFRTEPAAIATFASSEPVAVAPAE